MFHTFEGFKNPAVARPANGRSRSRDANTSGKRTSTARACEQCRRRKIRCDGEQPCEACQWYKKADLCQYSDPRPSRRHVEKLSTTLDEYRSVVEKLFPTTPIETLSNCSRQKLLELAYENHNDQQPSPSTSPAMETHVSPLSPEDENLECLQTMPEESSDSRGSMSPDLISAISDDVNALSLTSKRPSTYLGISSVLAVMRVIMWIDHGAIAYFSRTPDEPPQRPNRNYSFSSDGRPWQANLYRSSSMSSTQTPVRTNSLQLINAYFAYFHSFIPLIDEPSFRETFIAGKRSDPRWMALLNMVFALGSIAAYTADDTSHELYYQRARHQISLDSLGSAHLETVQTLALMGGFYLHYASQPNLAHTLMGSALRMATTLGLHREFIDTRSSPVKYNQPISIELRRRIWWSLFCLDTWAYMTLGRPSLGRWGPAITAKLPHYAGNRASDALAASPLVNYAEMANLDNQLVEWYNNLPPLLKTHEPCPDTVSTTRTIMRWRYQNQRILLHRPVLLSYAMRKIPYVAIRAEERAAIEKCRLVADETIRDISSATRLNQMSGWNAVWFIFQATLVPLLGLFIADSTAADPTATVESCRTQVEIAIISLARMQSWSPTAKRTLEVVSRIFEASRRGRDNDSGNNTNTHTHNGNTNGNTAHDVDGNNAQAQTSLPPPQTPTSAHDMNHHVEVAELHFQNSGTVNTIPLMEDSTGNMWDYLTWSDSNLWTGLTGPHPHMRHESGAGGGGGAASSEVLGVYAAEEEFMKHHDPGAVPMGGMYEQGYLPSNSITFQ
ncbi:hypothetical protein AJ80_09755 [Polytolypa hystricis UAMH7299]|uniref:Zn(2)-C6 fungal-type domain-containing protein n=1 Tax=Polytolypa hystricis (strain UAMH7299) TaxID=1447883 RepID=A0A2B7WK32_POLH7|nr:hypothetical protein AJ80_09755 [Polytolypa hystricis UAMH7299]